MSYARSSRNANVRESTRRRDIKIAADSVTLNAGTSADGVADLRTANDGNVYTVAEASATPGIQLIVDFVGVPALDFVRVMASYAGADNHALEIELYNWTTTSWDHLSSLQNTETNTGTIFENHSFIVVSDVDYLGDGANLGEVRVRINHPMPGNASHELYVDEVGIYW